MKILMLVMALVFAAPAVHGSELIDGSWFDGGCFGCPGDKVKDEVIEQQADADLAEAKLETDRSAVNLETALDLALFSYIKAGHALELGDLARQAGNKEDATKWYQATLKYCAAAKAMPDNVDFKSRKGKNVPKTSHAEGARWEKYATAGLEKLK